MGRRCRAVVAASSWRGPAGPKSWGSGPIRARPAMTRHVGRLHRPSGPRMGRFGRYLAGARMTHGRCRCARTGRHDQRMPYSKPPRTGADEKGPSGGFLDYLRAAVAAEAEGVPEPQVRTAGVASDTEPAGSGGAPGVRGAVLLLGEDVGDWKQTMRPAPDEMVDGVLTGRPGCCQSGERAHSMPARTWRSRLPGLHVPVLASIDALWCSGPHARAETGPAFRRPSPHRADILRESRSCSGATVSLTYDLARVRIRQLISPASTSARNARTTAR